METPKKPKDPEPERAGVLWKGCNKSTNGMHELRDGERVYPGESFICKHCGRTIWWDLSTGGY